MRKARILYKGEEAGMLIQHDDGSFTFKYNNDWFKNSNKPAISLTLPKKKQEYKADILFPFFFHMLPEGTNKQAVCLHNRIDHDDFFGLLMTSARIDAIGAVRVLKVND